MGFEGLFLVHISGTPSPGIPTRGTGIPGPLPPRGGGTGRGVSKRADVTPNDALERSHRHTQARCSNRASESSEASHMSTALRVFTLGARSLRSKCTLEVERWRCSAPGVGVETCLSLPPTLSLPREGGGDLEFQCRA